jgi:hypothetical protein
LFYHVVTNFILLPLVVRLGLLGGADVVVQGDFQQHGGTMLQKLEGYIDSCDREFALVGGTRAQRM